MVKLFGFKEKKNVDEALKLFLNEVKVKISEKESLNIEKAVGRILAEDIFSSVNVPHFNRSAVDGYAVKAEDTFGASKANPILLKLSGKVEIGEKSNLKIEKGQAVRVSTGSMLPKGTNAVVKLEDAEEIGEYIEIYKSVAPGENVSKIGEDIKAGEIVLKKGTIIEPHDLGLLATIGVTKVKVLRKPKVAIFSTGNELAPIGSKVEEGQVIETNRLTISAALNEMGCEVVDLGIVKDNIDLIEGNIKIGLKMADAVIISGGTSVGGKDLVPEAIQRVGKLIVHGISMKPGMPTGLAVANGKPIFMLPGFPVAALVSFYTFVPRVIEKMVGFRTVKKKWEKVKVILERRIPSTPGERTFVRVLIRKENNKFIAEPVRISGSGIMSSMVKANAIIIVEEEKEGIEKGEEAEAVLIRPILEQLR